MTAASGDEVTSVLPLWTGIVSLTPYFQKVPIAPERMARLNARHFRDAAIYA
jgi:hypothetical protein